MGRAGFKPARLSPGDLQSLGVISHHFYPCENTSKVVSVSLKKAHLTVAPDCTLTYHDRRRFSRMGAYFPMSEISAVGAGLRRHAVS